MTSETDHILIGLDKFCRQNFFHNSQPAAVSILPAECRIFEQNLSRIQEKITDTKDIHNSFLFPCYEHWLSVERKI